MFATTFVREGVRGRLLIAWSYKSLKAKNRTLVEKSVIYMGLG
jgi:hypothetical protein